MQQFIKMKNPILPYAWGSYSAIGTLLDLPVPANEPQAELWMGAHPKAPSQVFWQGAWHPLTELLEKKAKEIIGERGYKIYGRRLPYLFKILAAKEPLSIQAHPDKAQAKAGYARENMSNIPLAAKHRNYKDDNHKPECLCALTPFVALDGFRPVTEIIRCMREILPRRFEYLLAPLEDKGDANGLKTFFNQLLTLSKTEQRSLIEQIMSHAGTKKNRSIETTWLINLHKHYPKDIGILSPFYLNLIELAPGQAIFLKAGVLHAYLRGTGIELMANSDNVLRGGLTTKHVDVEELMCVLRFESESIVIQTPVDSGRCQKKFVSPFEEFELSIITVDDGESYVSEKERGAEILLCTEGYTVLTDLGNHTKMELVKGQSVLIPADLYQYRLSGIGMVYKAKGPV
jgi:mannose-6-phosphate isomerase